MNRSYPPKPVAAATLRRALILLAGTTLLAAGSANAQGAQATVTLNATVLEVQCTAQQRLRIRACAPAQESWSREGRKVLLARNAARGELAGTAQPQYDVRVDAGRQVMIRTLLY